MTINALNSGADGFMADFEDANAPTWHNMVDGHRNLRDAIDRTITYDDSDGRHYELAENPATLLVRPRGWHLPERHPIVDGEPVSGALFDFGLYVFHCARRLLGTGTAPYFYLPKLESHLEARLWNDVFGFAQDALGHPAGDDQGDGADRDPAGRVRDGRDPVRAPRALRRAQRRPLGLHLLVDQVLPGRPEMVLPDRVDVTMTVPFMRAYTELLVATCHRRGAHAMGGMSALIPSRKGDQDANEKALDGVRTDKEREVSPGLRRHMGRASGPGAGRPRGIRDRPERRAQPARPPARRRERHARGAARARRDPGRDHRKRAAHERRRRLPVRSFWLTGRGAAAINNLMEDVATAEISRSQIWQWVRHGAVLADGRPVTAGSSSARC